jgi:hypothetical protein
MLFDLWIEDLVWDISRSGFQNKQPGSYFPRAHDKFFGLKIGVHGRDAYITVFVADLGSGAFLALDPGWKN